MPKKAPVKNISLALSYDDVLLVPKYSEVNSRLEVSLATQLSKKLKLNLPFISANMDTVTGVEMALKMGELGALGILSRFDALEVQIENVKKVVKGGQLGAASIGIRESFLKDSEELYKAGAEILTLDVAHGHMKKAIEGTSKVKNKFGNKITLISGNVATAEGAYDLYKAGADCVKVGIGPGSICTTRIVTGFGVPQITALLDVSKIAKKLKKTFIADAGIKNSGDIVKALACGASAVMCGSLFAGTDEAPGAVIEIGGRLYKEYNGSTSLKEKEAQVKKNGNGKGNHYVAHVEGVEGLVQYKGSVASVVVSLSAGVRSGLSYAGAKDIPTLWKNAQFIQITTAGMRESNAHDILVKTR